MTDPATDSAPARRAPAGRSGVGMGSAWTVLTVRGVPVRIDTSWLLMAGLVVYVAYGRYVPLLGDLGQLAVLTAAVGFAVVFFASILLHEFGHAFASLDRGIPVASITLFALGGVTESTREVTRARDEFVIVGIGPFVSLVLAALSGLVFLAVEPFRVPAAVAGYAAWTNLLLAVFNLVPGYPLDGGRLLRSILWAVSGRPHRATRWAARVGQGFAIALGVFAIGPALGLRLPFAIGPLNVLIAWFLFRGATDAHRRATFRERLTARTARQLMGTAPPVLPADLPVGDAVARVRERPSLLWPVGDPLVGGVTLARLDELPDIAWDRPVAGVAYPLEQVAVDVDADVESLLERMGEAPGAMLLVVEDGRVAGLVTPSLVVGLGR